MNAVSHAVQQAVLDSLGAEVQVGCGPPDVDAGTSALATEPPSLQPPASVFSKRLIYLSDAACKVPVPCGLMLSSVR